MNLLCREIAFGSPLYHITVELRKRVLRTPLGLDWEPDAFAGEEKSFHIGVFSEEHELLGCLILKPLGTTELKMRQVAIEPGRQGQGVGGRLLAFSEEFAKTKGYRRISAHARETALTFYQRHGYDVSGEMFLELTVPHFAIAKSLAEGA